MTRREWLILRAWHEWDKGPVLPQKLFTDMLQAGINPDQEKRFYDIYSSESKEVVNG